MSSSLILHKKGRAIIFIIVVALGLGLDLVSKQLALAHLEPGVSYTLIPGVMDLLLVRNTGAAFSMGEGSQWLFILIAIVVVAGLAVAVVRTERLPMHLVVFAGVVAAGALGNLVDRVTRGWVCDFFCPTFINFAVFNVADIFVTCGIVGGLVFYFIWENKMEKERSKDR